MAEKQSDFPPPVLDCARVLRYVIIDKGIEFSGRSLLFVQGKELGQDALISSAESCLCCALLEKLLQFFCVGDFNKAARCVQVLL
jgi:hypothetical protein